MRILVATLLFTASATTFCRAQTHDTAAPPASVDTTDLPEPDAFIPVEREASYNEGDLQRSIRYPADARNKGVEGTVILRVMIGKDGEIKKLVVDQHADPLLDEAAISAVKEIKFTPAMSNGQPVATWKQIELDFRLGR